MLAATPRYLIVTLLIGMCATVAFLAGLPGEFVFDDLPNIVNNDAVRLSQINFESLLNVAFSPQRAGNMRVLPILSFALDYWRAGWFDPSTFKITNIIIHAITTALLVWLYREILLQAGISASQAKWTAPILALIWAAHPLQVSAVLYVVQRMQTMGTLFLVAALLAYLHARRCQIDGQNGRKSFLISFLMWLLAMGCKEDTVLLPAYTLALELTILKFNAANSATSLRLRRAYGVATTVGILMYALYVVPHYWHWDAYPGREFSTPERLYTQARVLCLYLWQIVLPLPSHMPFFYDGLQLSRGMLNPVSTLFASGLITALVLVGWKLRTRSPLAALGIFLFFSAHFITSNVIGIELAFEHRNHFALIGAVLAISQFFVWMADRLKMRQRTRVAAASFVIVLLAGTTTARSHDWRNNYAHAKATVALAPSSARAWFFLCTNHLAAGGGMTAHNPRLPESIMACSEGTRLAPYSLHNPALLVVLKTLQGNIHDKDWVELKRRISTVSMRTYDNRRAPMVLAYAFRKGVQLDREQLLEAMEALGQRDRLMPIEIATIGYFLLNDLNEADRAYPYFARAVAAADSEDPFPSQIEGEYRSRQRNDLADKLKAVALSRNHQNVSH